MCDKGVPPYIVTLKFIGKYKTLESLYIQINKTKTSRLGNYNSIKYSYISTIKVHKTVGKVKIVFIKIKENFIPIISTNTNLSESYYPYDKSLHQKITWFYMQKLVNLVNI